jgi:DeoR/GlpR family transcriptional regulator of sugar metabolism
MSKAQKLVPEHGYYRSKLKQNIDHKRAVARELLSQNLIHDGDPMVLDAGTSVSIAAELIFASDLKNLSILTHSIAVFQQFYEGTQGGGHEVLLTGGGFDQNYNALYGKVAESAYSAFNARVVILAISGLTALKDLAHEPGIYCHAVVETRLKEILFKLPTDRRIIVADYTKIGHVDSHLFGTIGEIKSNVLSGGDCLITTEPPADTPAEEVRLFRETIDQLKEWKVNVYAIPAPQAGASASESGSPE